MQTEKTIYALGFFDGVHLGHQALLKACRQLADARGCKAGAVTFAVHPDALVAGKAPFLLNTIDDRKRLLHAYGMDSVVVLPFDETLMRTHWSSFLRQLVDAGAAGFVCGSDFHFGAQGSGTAKKLSAFCKKQALACAIVPLQTKDGIRISSTVIRELLENAAMQRATEFLGHPHVLTAEVIPGRGLGRTLGTPTANLQLSPGVLLPKQGVYACTATVNGQTYPAVTNIGTRPTVDGHHVTVEPWLLDFEGDLYGKQLTLCFFDFLRPEKKFDSLDALQQQIHGDAEQTRRLLNERSTYYVGYSQASQ